MSKDVTTENGVQVTRIPRDTSPVKAKARKKHQLEVREKIQATTHYNHAVKTLEKLGTFGNLQGADKNDPEHPAHLSKDQISALKLVFDGHMKVLNKVLPDIKAVEHTHTGSIEHKKPEELTESDLERIIAGEVVYEGEWSEDND